MLVIQNQKTLVTQEITVTQKDVKSKTKYLELFTTANY